MVEEQFIKVAEQIGELNGSVKSLTEIMSRYADSNERIHQQHSACCSETKVEIGKINARHSTYWKVIGSFGGLGAVGAFLSKFGLGGPAN